MAQTVEAIAAKQSPRGFVYAALILGWLIPGGGHFLERRWVRGALLFFSITSLFTLGIAMHGKLYSSFTEILDMLSMVGDMGSGLLFFVGRIAGLGQDPVQITSADYGTKFIVVAGLLNMISAVDAHNIRIGRKG